jgi:hypothetical protein
MFPQCSSTSLFFRILFVATLAVGIAFLLPTNALAETQLVCSPTLLRFGAVPMGKTESLMIALTNTGKTSITITATSVSNSAFQVSGLKLPVEVAAGQSINLNMDFAPKTDEWTGGEVAFISTASNPKALLQMEGAGEKSASLTAEPSSLSFGDLNMGTSATHSVVVTNNTTLGTVLTTGEAAGTGFSVKGPHLPMVLDPHKSVTLDVTFDPKSAGEAGGSIFILLPGLVVPLSGTGVTSAVGKLLTSPSSLNFGSEDVGTETAKDVTLTATGGRVTISSGTSSNSEFSISGTSFPLTLNSGESAPLKVVFSPAKSGAVAGTLTLTSNASDSHVVGSLSGTGVTSTVGKLLTSPSSLNFGSEDLGTETAKDVTLTASGGRVTISSGTSSNSEFSISGTSFPLTLNSGESASLKVVFSPSKSGAVTGTLTLTSNASDERVVGSLSGTGVTSAVGKLLTSPSSLNFGSEDVGTETAKDVTLTATGGRVTISSGTSSNSEFSISGTSFPLTLNSGESASLKVVFSPSKSGAVTGTLTLTSNASDSHAIEGLSGTAVSAEYSVDLSWKASTSHVAGYNVYRGTSVGDYSQINSQLDASTNYTDKTVVPGNTYYYAATSVNSAGEESTYSTPIEVKIP